MGDFTCFSKEYRSTLDTILWVKS